MLLNFEVENYKSFYERVAFKMTPAPKQKGLDYSILSEEIKGKVQKSICSAVIYGPNASGKTNIIGAMDTLRAIVLRGNIRNSENDKAPNQAAYDLELIPNSIASKTKPVYFKIEFVESGMKIAYELSILLGAFLEEEFERTVESERLEINDVLIFARGKEVELGIKRNVKEYISEQTLENYDTIKMMVNQSVVADELFLTNGFKLLISQPVAKIILDWFEQKLMVLYRANSIKRIKRLANPEKDTVYYDRNLNEAAKVFGISSNNVGFVTSDDGEAKLYSIFRDRKGNLGKAVNAEIFESYGTIRFINIFPAIIGALTAGGTLIVDEFDASIHPMALMNIINIFHNDEINKKHAQLIFNTHNPIFLNSNIFRRDEIKFVEKDDDSFFSEVYSLSDFGTSGDTGVRKGDDYMKNYFINQYGAIKSIDFSSVVEKIMLEYEDNGK